MSRADLPKQLIPFIEGRSLLQIAYERLEGLVPPERRYVCAGQGHRKAVLAALPKLGADRFLGEPVGRDTLAAVGFAAAVLAARDPDAVIAVFTADHLIEPGADFRRIVQQGFALAEAEKGAEKGTVPICAQHPPGRSGKWGLSPFPPTLVTFGITPTGPATSYGYLELGPPIGDTARLVRRFHEKPPPATAEDYFRQGPEHYLWNSGMFVWRAATLLDCVRRYEPTVFEGLQAIGQAWDAPRRDEVLARVYPALKKISVDFAVMEPASRDESVRVAAVPMPLKWLDVGSWPSYAQTCPHDQRGNALAAEKHLLLDTSNCLVASSEPEHLIAAIGCQDLIVIHTSGATLICPADKAEQIKELYERVEKQFGERYA
jgi:mannose-1-phosphate guanylyltransferase